MTKILVPDGMLAAVDGAISEARHKRRRFYGHGELASGTVRDIALDAALRWLSENPIVPTWQQIQDMSPQADTIGIHLVVIG